MSTILRPFRSLRALYGVAALVHDPNRLNEVFEMADALATPENLNPIIEDICRLPGPAGAFDDRHRLKIDLPLLRQLPEGSFGRAFAAHMDANSLDPGAIPRLASPDAFSFFRAHLYETHDIWHVVTGFGTDWPSEMGLQGFYLAQLGGPLPAMLLMAGVLRIMTFERTASDRLLDLAARGWSLGKRGQPFFGVRWDDYWDVPLAEVRRQVGLGAV